MKKNLKKYNIGLIGCGKIGFLRRTSNSTIAPTHFHAILKNKNFSLQAVCDKNKKILKNISETYKIKTYEKYSDFLKNHKFDIIVVATNTDSHYQILREIIKYKPKIVFCEKPLTNKPSKAIEMINIYKKNKIKLMVNYSRRFLKEYLDLHKDIIQNKKIGQIKWVSVKYNRGFKNNCSHFIDLITWFFGKPDKIKLLGKSKCNSFNNDHNIYLNLFFKNNLIVNFSPVDINNLIVEEIDIMGSKGKISINSNFEFNYFNFSKSNDFQNLNTYIFNKKKRTNVHSSLINSYKNIVNYLINNNKLSSADLEIIEGLKIINKIYEKI